MSLVRYRPKNHPQQMLARGGADEAVDDRATTPADFARFAEQLGPFTIDVAAAAHNTKCERFFSYADDGLRQSWAELIVNQEGQLCRCKCHHSSSARNAASGNLHPSSPLDQPRPTGCTASAGHVTESGQGIVKDVGEQIQLSGPWSSQKSSGTTDPTEGVSGSVLRPSSTTTGAGSPTDSPTSGPPNCGPKRSGSGLGAAPGAAHEGNASRTISSPSLTPTAQELCHGTSLPPAPDATGARGSSTIGTGLIRAALPPSSNTCERCAGCTLETRQRVWVNPPYSRIGHWVDKAWREHEACDGIVMLLPANRTEQGWWQQMVEPYRDRVGSPLRVVFLAGRMRFIAAGADRVGPNERPPFGCCLLTWGIDHRFTDLDRPHLFAEAADQ